VSDWLAFTLLTMAWTPPLVLLHELAHGVTALIVTDGEVTIGLERGGLRGGWASYDRARLRRPRDEAWIAAAGPLSTLLIAVVLWLLWIEHGPHDGVSVIFAGAWTATTGFVGCALPVHYGAGLGGWGESDGRVFLRVLNGGPPGGLERELRRLREPEQSVRPVFAVLAVLLCVLGFVVDPVLGWVVAGLFGWAALQQLREPRG
jgi:hypothetical protein